ncbi:hypothetical protein ABZ234_03835 [Nocardiopsis sp. NPDC006198]|uniref:hypothetical protein n=1 Tax=Nocardiopsis sp. NPDC006198 TaxID=3154472 RepID=UPI0033B80B4D
MTDALIGALSALGGALVALLGAFGVQLVAGRQKRKEHVARLGGQFLSHSALYASALRHAHMASDHSDAEIPFYEVPHLKEAMEAATELSLLAGREVTYHVQSVEGAMNSLVMLTLPGVEREVWRSALSDFGAKRLELQDALRRELGSGAMPDDELGHDVPDIEAPSSTHTPWS